MYTKLVELNKTVKQNGVKIECELFKDENSNICAKIKNSNSGNVMQIDGINGLITLMNEEIETDTIFWGCKSLSDTTINNILHRIK